MIVIDGKLTDSVSVADRSFHYGDGCFTTMLCVNGQVQLWPQHKQRLLKAVYRLNLLADDSDDMALVHQRFETDLTQQLHVFLHLLSEQSSKTAESFCVIKLMITRGDGVRGYSPSGALTPRIIMMKSAYPEHYQSWQSTGVELGVSEVALGLCPHLAGIKHNNRLEQVLARGSVESQGFQDGVVLDLNDHVIETTMANLFWVVDDRLCTPSLDNSGVEGIMRAQVLALARSLNLTVCVDQFKINALLLADEVFMTNAVLGVAPVIKVQERVYLIGSHTKKLQKVLNLC